MPLSLLETCAGHVYVSAANKILHKRNARTHNMELAEGRNDPLWHAEADGHCSHEDSVHGVVRLREISFFRGNFEADESRITFRWSNKPEITRLAG